MTAEPDRISNPPIDQSAATPTWNKAIPMARDRRQSQALTVAVTILLLLAVLHLELAGWQSNHLAAAPLAVSLAFAITVWRLRSATAAASAIGAMICLLLATPAAGPVRPQSAGISPALLPLIVLFLLTFAATRFKRHAKQAAGLSEPRHGRRASQIVANLGVAGLSAAVGFYPGTLAALAEATADTVSSEIGQALGGPTWLLTGLRRVSPGTDGGISLSGTAAGLAASAFVTFSGSHGRLATPIAAAVLGSSSAGLLFDSLLGATLERRGLLGNDLVNFSSTLFSVVLTWLLLSF